MERASARLTELEAMHTALAALIRRGAAEPAGKVEVVFFERAEDFYEVAGQERTKGGYFTTRLAGDIQPQPIMVMPSNFAEETRELFQHELAHRPLFTCASAGSQPGSTRGSPSTIRPFASRLTACAWEGA